MDRLERFRYWKGVAVDALRAAGDPGVTDFEKIEFKDEDQFYGYFGCFRPEGKGVESVFAGVVGGDEVVQRLRKVYAATNESYGSAMYFVVRKPFPATHQEVEDLTRKHLERVRLIAEAFGNSELVKLSASDPVIEIKCEHRPNGPRDYNSPETLVYDVVCDWFGGIHAVESEILLLREAFYSMACDYYIADYVMWPLYRHGTEVDEAFEPYFELWRRGAQPFFGKPGLITVYLPYSAFVER